MMPLSFFFCLSLPLSPSLSLLPPFSASQTRNKRVQHLNLQKVKYTSVALNRVVKMRLSTKGLKTVAKYGGIDEAAKKFGIDLRKF